MTTSDNHKPAPPQRPASRALLRIAAMLPIYAVAASTAAGLDPCDVFVCGGNHNETAAPDTTPAPGSGT